MYGKGTGKLWFCSSFMWGYCIHCGGHLLIYTVANNEYTLNGVFIAEHVDNVDSMGFGGESIDVPTFQANDWCPLNRSERSLHFVKNPCVPHKPKKFITCNNVLKICPSSCSINMTSRILSGFPKLVEVSPLSWRNNSWFQPLIFQSQELMVQNVS